MLSKEEECFLLKVDLNISHYRKPVSYTHLDVYKRQAGWWMKFSTYIPGAWAIWSRCFPPTVTAPPRLAAAYPLSLIHI